MIGPTDAKNCTVVGEAIKKVECRVQSSFVIEARDSNGNRRQVGGDDFIVSIRGNSVVNDEVTDNGDGTYTVEFKVPGPSGIYKISIMLEGETLKGSPFKTDAYMGPNSWADKKGKKKKNGSKAAGKAAAKKAGKKPGKPKDPKDTASKAGKKAASRASTPKGDGDDTSSDDDSPGTSDDSDDPEEAGPAGSPGSPGPPSGSGGGGAASSSSGRRINESIRGHPSQSR